MDQRPLDDASFVAAVAELAERDPVLASAVRRNGAPPFWTRPAGFPTLVLLVLEQQVSLASGRATYDRLDEATGIDPERVVAAADGVLRAAGLSRQKERYVRGLARAVVDGDLRLDEVAELDDAAARAALVAQVGVGPWTADCYLLAALRRPDVWPAADRALQVAAAEVAGLDEVPGAIALTEMAERWRPWRAVAARILWHDYLNRRNRVAAPV
jgi:DNA-3-methyladenine glycosylase II